MQAPCLPRSRCALLGLPVMMQIVQARCPYCKNTLRIPGDWLNQPMKCKHCQQIFQTKVKSPEAAPPAMAVAAVSHGRAAAPAHAASIQAAPPMVAVPAGQQPFGFDPYDDSPALNLRSRRKGGSGWWKVGLLGGGLLAVAGVATAVYFFLGPHLGTLFKKEDKDAGRDKVAIVTDKGSTQDKANTDATDKN